MTLSVVIVSYNTKGFLKGCLNSISRASSGLSLEVVVVDNASKDDSVEMIKKEFPRTVLISNKDNVGFSKANNQGVKKTKGAYVLFLNPDVVVEENTLRDMVKFMEEREKVGASTCKVLLESGAIDDASHRGFPTPWNSFAHFSGLSKILGKTKLFGGYNLGWKNLGSIHEVDALAGAFMIVRRNAGEEVGWWDEDFFFYGEDLDFCYRLKERGWKIFYNPQTKVLHYKGVSHGLKKHSQDITTADEETKTRSQKERFRAMRLFYKKHYTKKYPTFVTWLVMQGISLKENISS